MVLAGFGQLPLTRGEGTGVDREVEVVDEALLLA
jgi:hypothetical protein